MKSILFITNGHGEDIVTAEIIRNMNRKNIQIDVLPVVGRGDVFARSKVNIIGPRKVLPGGGFGLRNFSYLIKDIFSGLISKVLSQVRTLRKNKGKYDLVIGIGDIVPIIYASIVGGRFIFVGINKSSCYKRFAFNYIGIEKWLLKKYCSLTLTRHAYTSLDLNRHGIRAKYLGNPMMDLVQNIRRSGEQMNRKIKTIGFLPGTREDAYKNIEDFNKVAWKINRSNKDIKFIMSFPKNLDKNKLKKKHFLNKIRLSSSFNAVLKRSSIIIGLSGTGNEQAAGCGIPVISFPGRGAQYNFKFAQGQKELLGDGLLLVTRNSDSIATAALSLLFNPKQMARMSKMGRHRMGRPGASKKIVGTLLSYLQR